MDHAAIPPTAPESRPDPAELRASRATDADEHAQNLSRWDQRYDQLSPGAFAGSVTELWLPRSQVFVETANQRLRQTCAAWPRSVWFGIPAAAEGMMTMGGRPLSAGAVCVRDGGAEFDLLTAPDFNLFGIVVDRAAFAEHLETVHHRDLEVLLRRGAVVDLARPRKENLCATLAAILADAGQGDRIVPARDLQARIFDAMADVLGAGESTPPPGRTRQQRQQTVDRVREYLLQHPDCPPSIPELCTRFHLSRRALQNCFEEVTGMAPLAYMRSLRLNEVRRSLRRTGGPGAVSDAAYAWGFTHLSQFARDYRRLFGELPSATGRRNPANPAPTCRP